MGKEALFQYPIILFSSAVRVDSLSIREKVYHCASSGVEAINILWYIQQGKRMYKLIEMKLGFTLFLCLLFALNNFLL